MGTDNKPVNDSDQAEVAQPANSSPVRSFTNAWILTDLGLFHVYCTIIGPEAEDPKHRLPLTSREAQGELKAIADLVVFLEKHARGEDTES